MLQGTGSVYVSTQEHATEVKYFDSPTEIYLLHFCIYLQE